MSRPVGGGGVVLAVDPCVAVERGPAQHQQLYVYGILRYICTVQSGAADLIGEGVLVGEAGRVPQHDLLLHPLLYWSLLDC